MSKCATQSGATKMKKASKILTLILIVVFALSVFAGCDLVGRNTAKYRSTVAMTVGNEEITIGKLLDTFNNYYNSYYYYVSAGYFDIEYLLEMTVSSLLQQYMQIDNYVKTHDAVTPSQAKLAHNAEYLTEDQFIYCIKYVIHSAFTTFDQTVITNLSVKHEIGDAEEEDTSRDFIKYDDLKDAADYAEYTLNKNFDTEEIDEYFEKYYNNSIEITVDSVTNIAKDYVCDSEEVASTILAELNERLEDDGDEITFDEYQQAQQKALEQYSDTVKSNYGITLQKFLQSQLNDMVSSGILALWSYEQYKDIDSELDEIIKTANKLNADAQAAQFAIDKDFDSFITGLSDNSFIYDVPADMQGKYVFVKNILIPFTSQDSAWLNAQASSFGGTNTDAFKALRDKTAAKITARYFDSDKYDETIEALFEQTLADFLKPEQYEEDEKAEYKYKKIGNLFTNTDKGIAINPDGALGKFFGAGGVVNKVGDLEGADLIAELMKRFNTDTAQHSTRYDYVVYVGDDWEDYSHNWVKEFYTAVNELGHKEDGSFDPNNIGKYAMCVSTYGVHIIYVDSFVENSKFNPDTAWTNTDSLSYVRYKEQFNSLMNTRTKEALEALQKEYLSEKSKLVTVNKQFARFLKDNDFTFDFDEFKKDILAELD